MYPSWRPCLAQASIGFPDRRPDRPFLAEWSPRFTFTELVTGSMWYGLTHDVTLHRWSMLRSAGMSPRMASHAALCVPVHRRDPPNLNRVLPRGEFLPVPLLSCITFGPPLWLEVKEPKMDFLKRARDAVRSLKER